MRLARIKAVVIVGLGAVLATSGCDKKKSVDMKDDMNRASYAIGVQTGRMLKMQKIDINTDALSLGINDVLEDKELKLNDNEAREAMRKLREKAMAAAESPEAKKQKEDNLKKGDEFLAENKKKEGVKVTESGLQYTVVKEGDGPMPKETDNVEVHYHGTLIDGKVFDSSVERGQPAKFPVNGVIPGWVEALQKMKVGSKWKLFIPAKLAYGEREMGDIPANSALIFDVELLGINAGGDGHGH
ncbi:MAG: FKBP-type peptidyl-prolyl cis-trans isomerase [Pseudobdellovibrionaceae bacterium]|nr:MAG: FKBP-type peptidyl-prolyl cis-trans isomerase [Pseudobdellovibrionaceae bacterium]